MTGVLRILVHNWPLKLGAIVLACLLYGGLIVSQSSREFPGSIPVEGLNQATNVIVMSDLGVVRRIRYFAPEDIGVALGSSSFRATVDFSGLDPAATPTSLTVRVVAIDPRIQVLDYEPRRITVRLDKVVSRVVPVRPVLGDVPAGLDIGDPTVSVSQATVTGPSEAVGRVTEAQARVQVDASGVDVNRIVELVAVDALGEPVTPIDIEPATARVKLPIFTNRQTRTLPVNPTVAGTPAAGFEIASVTVEPLVVSVEGDADALASLARVDTVAVSISGATSDVVTKVALDLPEGISPLGDVAVSVHVALRPVTGTRTFQAGLILVGARADRVYALSTDHVLVTIGGSVADLDRLSGASLVLTLDVTGLDVGSVDVHVGANLITGLTLVAADPDPVGVTITAPAASPTPGPSSTPGP